MADFLPTRSVLKVCLPVCLLNSGELEQIRKSKEIDRCLSREKTYVKRLVKILLLGAGESGKSTFLKQMRIIHGQDFDQDAREEFRATIYSNVIKGRHAAVGRCPLRGRVRGGDGRSVAKFAHLLARSDICPRHTHKSRALSLRRPAAESSPDGAAWLLLVAQQLGWGGGGGGCGSSWWVSVLPGHPEAFWAPGVSLLAQMCTFSCS